jgi:Concanavalin A-like lectin/glucanases superfamily
VHNTTISGWTHIAVVYTAKQPTLYINGVFAKTGLTSNITNVTPSAHLGEQGAGYGYFQGDIDEVRIWNTPLPQAVIQGWKDQPVSVTHPNYGNLAGYWKLDEGAGTLTSDASAGGVTGTLVNGPLWIASTLPLQLNGFSAASSGNGHMLRWNTTQETQVTGFIIQRSRNGAFFDDIGTVAARGGNGGTQYYQYCDALMFDAHVYYRLKVLHAAGSITYSAVVRPGGAARGQVHIVRYGPPGAYLIYPEQQVMQLLVLSADGRQVQNIHPETAAGPIRCNCPLEVCISSAYCMQVVKPVCIN